MQAVVGRSFAPVCGRAQVLHVATRTLRPLRLAPVPPDFPTRQVHHSGELGVQCLCLVDHLLHGGVGGAKTKPAKDSTDVHVRRDVDREVVREGNLELPRKDVGGHASDLRADAVELQETIDNLRA